MGRRVALWLVLLAAWGFCAGAVAVAEEIDNPAYQEWVQYKPGSFVTHKSVMRMQEMTTETTITNTLKEVTLDRVVLEVVTVMTTAGQEMEMPPQTIAFPAMIEKPEEEAAEAPKLTEIERGKEELTINDVKIETEWVKTEFTQDEVTTISTVWTSDKVPNRVVKMETEVGGPMPMTMEMILVDYKADREVAE